MLLNLKNIGKIAEASVELNGITIEFDGVKNCYKGFCFKELDTYTQEEFHRNFVNKAI